MTQFLLYEIAEFLNLVRYLSNTKSVGSPKERKFAVALTINDDSVEPTTKLSNVIRSEH